MTVRIGQPPNISILNQRKVAYLEGSELVDTSIRFIRDSDTDIPTIQGRTTGLWQPSPFQVSPESMHIGLGLALSKAGHHLLASDTAGHFHFYAHNIFDGETSIGDARILNAYAFLSRDVAQPDNTGTFLGTNIEFIIPATQHALIKLSYLQTDTTAATSAVRYRIWKGTDDTGTKILDQTYPYQDFPAATILTSGTLTIGTWYVIDSYVAGDDFINVGAASNATGVEFEATGTTPTTWTNSSTLRDSEIINDAEGYAEIETGNYYFLRLSSDEDFSLKTNAAGTIPWFATDTVSVREDDMLQTTEWVDGETFEIGQLSIQDRQIYQCNTDGVQETSFAANSDLWNKFTANNFSYNEITIPKITIDAGQQMIVHGEIKIDGELIVNGELCLI